MICPRCKSNATRPGGNTCWDCVPGPQGDGEGNWKSSTWQPGKSAIVAKANKARAVRETEAKANGRAT